jgi:hypothetical protein
MEHKQKTIHHPCKHCHDFFMDTKVARNAPPRRQAVIMATFEWVMDLLAKASMKDVLVHAN